MTDAAAISGFRLSPQQERLWRSAPDASQPRSACVLRLSAPPDRERLAAALERLAARHSVLRTRLRKLPGLELPVQVIEEESTLAVDVAEARGIDGGETTLTLSAPAACADLHGLRRLAIELAAAYADPGVELPEPLEYLQYSEWRHTLREDEEGREGRDFWRGVLERRSPATALPWLGPNVAGAGVERRALPLDPAAAAGLLRAAGRAGREPEELLLAAWCGLLRRLVDREPLVAYLDDGRGDEPFAGAVGPYARPLPLDGELDEWRRSSAPWGDDFEAPAGVWATAGFRWIEWPAVIEAGELTMRLLGWRAPLEAAPAELAATVFGDRLTLELVYDRRRLEEVDARYLARLLESSLEAGGEDAGQGQVLPAAERHYLLRELNDTGPGWTSGEARIDRLFARRAAADAEAVAVVAGGEALSFGALERSAGRLAGRLRRRGVGPEVTVALCLERSVEMVVALLAVLEAGGAYVPLDPLHPPARLRRLLAESGARLLLTRESLWRTIGEPPAETVFLETIFLETARRTLTPPPPLSPSRLREERGEGSHLAYVLFTSGSTGRPKGVMVEHRSLANLAAALEAAVYRRLPRGAAGGGRLRVGLNAPLSFDASVKQWLQLLAGHTLEIVPEEVRPDPERWRAFVARRRLDAVDVTPSQLGPVAALPRTTLPRTTPPRAALTRTALPRAALLVGGEAIGDGLWRHLAARGAPGFDLYGPTECTVDATAAPIAGEAPHLGAPLAGVRVYVVDRRGEPAPRGVEGELAIAGAGLARGYAGAAGATAERFVPDALGGGRGRRLYLSGDRARRRRDGRLEYRGRHDHQVKLGAVRVELGEVEAALREHPRVREAVADLRPIEDGGAGEAAGEGSGQRQLVAWVVAADPVRPPDDLRPWLRERLPEVMVPARCVVLERLPLGRGGKLDRSRLPAAEPAPRAPYLAPRGRLEGTLAEIWQQVLGVERVGVGDSFFDLGGHSLLLLRVQEAVRERLGRELSLVEMFHHPTIAALARHLAGDSKPLGAPATDAPGGEDALDERIRRQRRALARRRPAAAATEEGS